MQCHRRASVRRERWQRVSRSGAWQQCLHRRYQVGLEPRSYRFLGVNDVVHFQIVLPCFADTSTTTLRPGVAPAMGYLTDAVPLVEAVAYLVFVVVLYLALVVTLERAPTLDTFTYVFVYWRG